ncbi:amidohydrolase family protein [Sphaerotilus sp.]|uniref:amidohydrolase n=1 Tax=Sphaerotilus sp. TaxID=2093942 RepID=UPI00286DF648|nr:amidohydrolase family protein [Sphaerotilus sp.]
MAHAFTLTSEHTPWLRIGVAGWLGLAGMAAAAAPDLLLVNAKVFTADPAQPYAQAVAIEAGRILAVGSDEQVRVLAGPGTRIIDTGGRLVTPGLIEAHVHLGPPLPTPPLAMPNLPFPGPSGEQVLAVVEQAAKARTDWISAFIGPLAARDRRNWRLALDGVAPNTPVTLRGFFGHLTLVNSEALRRLGITEAVTDPLGGWWGRDGSGRLDGSVYEEAQRASSMQAPPPVLAKAFGDAAQRYARWGVTSVHLMNNDKSLQATLDGLALANTGQKWTVYSWAMPVQRIPDAWSVIDAAPRQIPPRIRIEGPKWMLDGTPLEQNSFQREAHPGRPGWFGRSNYTQDQITTLLRLALERPTQLALHVVGDAETDRLLRTMEQLAPASAWQAKRVRFEHGDGLRPETLAQAARLGVVVVQNPTHLPPPPMPGALVITNQTLLLKSLLVAGIPLALGSDGGPTEQNPFLNLMLASLYPARPGEALSREQALTAYTAGAAYAEGQERRKGRIAVGLAADLAVLSQDVLTVPVRQLPATTSLLTLVDGEVIFEDAVFTQAR